MTTIEYDATNKILGRLASDIAITLRGKKTTAYRRDREADITVIVHNADKVAVSGTKEKTKMYYNFSGYPGGLKSKTLREVRAAHPERILKLAVKRMLPDNKLRDRILKRLILEVTAK